MKNGPVIEKSAEFLKALSKNNVLRIALLTTILAIALLVRVWHAHIGLPYIHHHDEPFIAGYALNMMKTGDFNPHRFNYGTLLIYMNLGVDILHYFHLMGQPSSAPVFLRTLDDIRTNLDQGWHWTISHPSFYLWNRGSTAVLGTLSILFCFLICKEIMGYWAGLISATFLSVLEIHVWHSAMVTTDIPAVCLVLGSIWFSLRFLRTNQPGSLIIALIFSGLAISVKYNAFLSIITPVAVLAYAGIGSREGYRHWLWVAIVAVPILAFLVGTPYATLDLPTFLKDVGFEVKHYQVIGHRVYTVEPGWPHAKVQFKQFRKELGMMLIILALFGAMAMLSRKEGWFTMLYPVVFFLFMINTKIRFHRNFLMLYPIIAISIGCGVVGGSLLLLYCFRRWKSTYNSLLLIECILLTVIAFYGLYVTLVREYTVYSAQETRSRIIDKVNVLAMKHKWNNIGIAKELRIHGLDLKRIYFTADIKSLTKLAMKREYYDAIISAEHYEVSNRSKIERVELARQLNSLVKEFDVFQKIGSNPLYLDRYAVDPAIVILTKTTQ